VAREPERISLRSAVGRRDETTASSAGSDGATGSKTNRDRDRHPYRLRTVLLALPDHDKVATKSTKTKVTKKHKRHESVELIFMSLVLFVA